jgi:biopolymer transport protein TolR
MQSRGRSGRQRRLVTDINVVPYIDVMLVLLVIFMVTAPLLPPGQMDLPSVGASPQKDQVYIDARVDKSGRIVLVKIDGGAQSEVPVTLNSLAQKARELGANDKIPVVVSADRNQSYGGVTDILDRLQSQNIRVALMVKPGK